MTIVIRHAPARFRWDRHEHRSAHTADRSGLAARRSTAVACVAAHELSAEMRTARQHNIIAHLQWLAVLLLFSGSAGEERKAFISRRAAVCVFSLRVFSTGSGTHHRHRPVDRGRRPRVASASSTYGQFRGWGPHYAMSVMSQIGTHALSGELGYGTRIDMRGRHGTV
jgi:hypothetical protein